MLPQAAICKLLSDGDYKTIVEHLREKKDNADTVIDLNWIINLKTSVDYFCMSDKNDITEQIENVIDKLSVLKEKRLHCSDYSATQDYEDDYTSELDKLIELLSRK